MAKTISIFLFLAFLYLTPTQAQVSRTWATYYGGLGTDWAKAIKADAEGNVYVLGNTASSAGMATEGAYQETYGGGVGDWGQEGDVFLAKFDAEGSLLWSTYFGGENDEGAGGIDLDSDGNIYICGWTLSTTGISTTGAHQESNAGEDDGFLAKFDNDGALLWATYYGGESYDNLFGGAGSVYCSGTDVYLCGGTMSETGIATTSAWLSAPAGSTDAYLAKFNSDGEREWATYFGGEADDKGIAVNGNGSHIYIAGMTMSNAGIGISGYQNAYGGGDFDGFLSQFDEDGTVVWSTYYGSTGFDKIEAITCDDDFVYAVGTTTSTMNIASGGSWQDVAGGGEDMYLAKFNYIGELQVCTYYGDTGNDRMGLSPSVTLDGTGNVYLCGQTNSAGGMVTADAFQSDYSESYDAILAKFDSDMQLAWASYMGGMGSDQAYTITAINNGKVYAAGATVSSGEIATDDAWQTELAGGSDAFLLALSSCEEARLNVEHDTTICEGISFELSTTMAGATYNWFIDGGMASMTDSLITVVAEGTYMLVTSKGTCTDTSVAITVSVNPAPTPVIVNTGGVLSTTEPYASYQWNREGAPITGATDATLTPPTSGNYSVTVTDANGCSGTSDNYTGIEKLKDELSVSIYPNPVKDVLTINVAEARQMTLYGADGRLLLSNQTLKKGVNSINLAGFCSGLYWIKISGNSGAMYLRKIVKE